MIFTINKYLLAFALVFILAIFAKLYLKVLYNPAIVLIFILSFLTLFIFGFKINKKAFFDYWYFLLIPIFMIFSLEFNFFDYAKFFYSSALFFVLGILFYKFGYFSKNDSYPIIVSILTFLITIYILIFVDLSFDSRELNPNFVGLFVYLFFIASICGFKKSSFKIIILIITLVITSYVQSRASLLSLIVFSLVYSLWPLIYRIPKLFIFLLSLLFLAVCYAYIYFTSTMQIEILFFFFDLQSDAQSFYTGRENLWSRILFDIQSNYFFGQGVGFQKDLLGGLANSAHNLFLQLYIQGGLVSVFLIIAFFIRLFFFSFSKKKEGRNMGSIIISLFTLCMFEVFIIENNIAYGLLLFSILAFEQGKLSNQTS